MNWFGYPLSDRSSSKKQRAVFRKELVRGKQLRSLCGLVVFLVSASSAVHAAQPESINALLEPYLAEFGLPAIAAAVFKDGEIIASGACGTRRAGQDIPVQMEDRFHIGSDSKAFTSLLAGQFVEEGKLLWDSTLADVFGELEEKMDPDFAKITLQELLSHSSGLGKDGPDLIDLIERSYQQDGNMDEVRYWMVKETAPKPLDHARGSKFAYSNLGYVIAGAILERVAGKSWEELVEERIIGPMDLKSAGFGPQASLGKVDAPLGHLLESGKPKAMLAGPNGDNPLILGPAGTLHVSVLDFAKWAAWHAGEGKRAPALISQETARRLHTPVIETGVLENPPPGTPKTGKYALGWGEVNFDWSPEPVLTHTGSNEMNLALVMIWPKADFGLVIVTNIAGEKADQALRKLAIDLYKRFFPGQAKAQAASSSREFEGSKPAR